MSQHARPRRWLAEVGPGAHGISGVAVHDARLVAFMNVYGVTRVLTLNAKDFARYRGINVIHPADLM